MFGEHLGIIHLIDVVAGKDKQVFRRVGVDKVDVLGDRISSSAVNIQISIGLLTRWEYIDAAVLGIQTPAASGCHITVQ